VQLFLVRHAEATPGQPDELRPLTPLGREQARCLGERLREQGVRPAVVLTSPLLRARETGELIAQVLGAETAVAEELAPGATPEVVTRAVRARSNGRAPLIAVGHQPDCGRIAAALTGDPKPDFPPGGSVAIRLDG
jgi:phosphohistidine phosphatase